MAEGWLLASCLAGRSKDPPHCRQVLALTTPSWMRLVLGPRTQGAKPDTMSAMDTLSLQFWNVLSRKTVDSMLEDGLKSTQTLQTSDPKCLAQPHNVPLLNGRDTAEKSTVPKHTSKELFP